MTGFEIAHPAGVLSGHPYAVTKAFAIDVPLEPVDVVVVVGVGVVVGGMVVGGMVVGGIVVGGTVVVVVEVVVGGVNVVPLVAR